MSSPVTPAATVAAPAADSTVDRIRALVTEDMAAVDRCIVARLASDVALVNQLGHYIISTGGKRLRPMTVLLSARACGYSGAAHTTLAATIEFIHTATLLHDDVVDGSDMRRGRVTANEVWGNAASVLVGDYLYSRAFEMMVDVDSMRVMAILARTTNTIAEGEVMQLMNVHDADTSEERYLAVIGYKTAKLFESAAQLGAVISGQPAEIETALATYGLELGIAFQLVDDVLDYTADAATLGKNVGDDLAEGKVTLPLIKALQDGTPEQVSLLRRAIEADGKEHIDSVLAAIESTGALAYTSALAAQHAAKAKAALARIPDSHYKDALLELADFSVRRDH